ncbi:MAG: AsmA family protein, partial [Flavisolibacter sp.]|nr:AsmA family protein [Flavisolibacter sp.]
MKKFLKYTGIVFLSLVVIAFFIPFLFKGKIVNLVKAEINKNIEAKVEFKDVSLSLFRHFPKLSIGLEDISVSGTQEFERDTLLSAKRIDASVNLWSAFSGSDMKVYGVFLQSPRIHALVNKNGKANWEITKEDTAASTGSGSSAFKVKLEKYSIKDGYVLYKDESSNMQMEIAGLDHEGSGDITSDIFTLATKTKAVAASFNYEGVPYLINAQTGIDADITIDNSKSKYSFKNAAIEVNKLQLNADGFIQIDNDSTYSMDLKFGALSNEFKHFLSLVPAIYKTDFDKIKTGGTASFKGFVKGSYSPVQLPSYSVDLDVKDGFFQYPDLPQPVKNINITMQVNNPDGALDHTTVNISKGHLEMGSDPFDFKVLFKNPETTQYIDAVLKGNLNLSNVSHFIKLEEGTKLSGLVAADAFAKGSLAAIEKQKGDFTAGGFFSISNLYYASKDFPQPVQNGNFKIQLENSGGIADATTVNISQGHLEVGNDPFDFSLKLSQPMSAINFTGTAKGKFTLDNIHQFTQLEPGTSIKGLLNADINFSGSKADIDKKNYEKINTTGIVDLSNVSYVSKEYPDGVTVQAAQLKFNPQNVALNKFDGRFKNTHLTADGVLDNLIGYAIHNQELKGTLNIAADKIMLNDWMGTPDTTTSTTTSTGAFPVPANMHITLNAKADAVQYDKVTYSNVRGSLVVKDETVRLQNVQTEALDGSIAFDGSYSTKQNKKNPDISLSYDVKNIDIQKAFYAYNTVQKLMPVGKFLAGKLTSQFSMTGKLDDKMFPDLTSLTGNGNMLLIEGVLKKFQPLDKLASTLDVSELKDVSVKDI